MNKQLAIHKTILTIKNRFYLLSLNIFNYEFKHHKYLFSCDGNASSIKCGVSISVWKFRNWMVKQACETLIKGFKGVFQFGDGLAANNITYLK